jgi:hypothetical protein
VNATCVIDAHRTAYYVIPEHQSRRCIVFEILDLNALEKFIVVVQCPN